MPSAPALTPRPSAAALPSQSQPAPQASWSIGLLARRSGCSVPTIRYYESIGLLPAARRSDSGHRRYGAASLAQLQFIVRARELGFSLEQVQALSALSGDPSRPCTETLQFAQTQLQALRLRLAELQALEQRLSQLTEACAKQCPEASASSCCITRSMTEPVAAAGKTAQDHHGCG